jgi:membrane fusion protein, multidrug efflux system
VSDRFLGWACLIVLAVGSMAGCGAREAATAQQSASPAVAVVRPERGDMARAITLPGDLVGFYESALHAKVTGYLKSIAVDKGDWVKKGQVLAEIEVPELEQKLERARASLQVRRVTYDRLKNVWATDRRLVAREDVDIAEGKFLEAKAQVEELEALVGYTHIIAPFDGVVTARYVDPGALIQASGHADVSAAGGTAPGREAAVPVVNVAAIDTLRVYVYVPEEESSLVRRGMPATLHLREFPGREFTGTVTRFATALDLSTRTMLTEVDLENPRHELYPGMYADVRVELDRHAGVLKIPAAAVGGPGDAHFVYVVADGRLVKRPVALGFSAEGYIEVASGLSGDEQIVASMDAGLKDGEPVHGVMPDGDGRAVARAE